MATSEEIKELTTALVSEDEKIPANVRNRLIELEYLAGVGEVLDQTVETTFGASPAARTASLGPADDIASRLLEEGRRLMKEDASLVDDS